MYPSYAIYSLLLGVVVANMPGLAKDGLACGSKAVCWLLVPTATAVALPSIPLLPRASLRPLHVPPPPLAFSLGRKLEAGPGVAPGLPTILLSGEPAFRQLLSHLEDRTQSAADQLHLQREATLETTQAGRWWTSAYLWVRVQWLVLLQLALELAELLGGCLPLTVVVQEDGVVEVNHRVLTTTEREKMEMGHFRKQKIYT